jgi:hypothetical protein
MRFRTIVAGLAVIALAGALAFAKDSPEANGRKPAGWRPPPSRTCISFNLPFRS